VKRGRRSYFKLAILIFGGTGGTGGRNTGTSIEVSSLGGRGGVDVSTSFKPCRV